MFSQAGAVFLGLPRPRFTGVSVDAEAERARQHHTTEKGRANTYVQREPTCEDDQVRASSATTIQELHAASQELQEEERRGTDQLWMRTWEDAREASWREVLRRPSRRRLPPPR